MKQYINGNLIELTVEQETAFENYRKTDQDNKIIRKQAQTDAANKKASGKQKLKDLGLDDDEIQALIGV